jgi:hypothetical protein
MGKKANKQEVTKRQNPIANSFSREQRAYRALEAPVPVLLKHHQKRQCTLGQQINKQKLGQPFPSKWLPKGSGGLRVTSPL